MSQSFDLIIENGTVVDGSGAAGRRADVAVKDGRIAAIGTGLGEAERVVDAKHRVVAPGFVDIHTHYDAQVLWDRMLTISPSHGVTSVVIGNCGFGIAPTRPEHRDLILRTLENVEGMSLESLHAGLGEAWPFETFPEYLDALERRGSAINVGALVGHTPVRMYVMGEESTEREASDDEIAQMRAIVDDSLRAGALGFATSHSPTHVGYAGRPVPSRASTFGEIEALASCLGEVGHGVMQATIGADLFLDQMEAIARRTGKPVSWTALLGGAFGPEGHRGILDRSLELQKDGAAVVPQVSGRPLMFEFQFEAPFPFEMMKLFHPVSKGDREEKKRLYASEGFRAAFRERREPEGFGVRWDRTEISDAPSDRSIEGRTVKDVADERGLHPADLALDLALASDLKARFRSAVANADESIVGEMLQHPAAMIGLSDAGAHASQLCDACFSTHMLGHWVREKKVLSLEQAVRLLTSRSAEIFGIRGRGLLAVGTAADVVVFDPDTVGCGPLRRVYDLPGGADRLVSDSFGIDSVVVNGVPIRERGEDLVDASSELPGRVLRRGGDV
jgi:N-acyl-D-aspartate/D-glutamate deacylase